MSRSFFVAVIFCFACNLLGWGKGIARASVVVALSQEQLVDAADAIVVATIGQQQAEYTKQGLIITRTELIVSEEIKGRGPKSVREIVTLGGEVGDVGMTAAGAPRFSTGERVVLFLRNSVVNELQVVGLAQGAFHIERAQGVDVVKQSTDNLVFVPGKPLRAEPQRLADFLGGVRALVAQKKKGSPSP